MILLTVGDSFTYGDGLENPEKDTWPTLLSNSLDWDLVNLAESGASNDTIFRKTIEFISNNLNEELFVIVGWSNPDRREERVNIKYKTNQNNQSDKNLDGRVFDRYYYDNKIFTSFIPFPTKTRNDDIVKFIYANLDDEEHSITKTVNYQISLQYILNGLGIKYLYFNSFLPLYSHTFYPQDILSKLKDRIRMIDHEKYVECGSSMKTFLELNGFDMLPDNHPDKEGHKFWAELILGVVKCY
jgi:hypothetical protein